MNSLEGVYVSMQEPDGCMALHVAVEKGDMEAVHYIRAHQSTGYRQKIEEQIRVASH